MAVIADTVYLAYAGLRFYHAAGRSIISRGLRTGAAGRMLSNWIVWRRRPRRDVPPSITIS
jgi:hypothetical protein